MSRNLKGLFPFIEKKIMVLFYNCLFLIVTVIVILMNCRVEDLNRLKVQHPNHSAMHEDGIRVT